MAEENVETYVTEINRGREHKRRRRAKKKKPKTLEDNMTKYKDLQGKKCLTFTEAVDAYGD